LPHHEIDAAISAHGLWKIRLKTAIAQGATPADVTSAERTDQCAFGKWLLSPAASPALRNSPSFREAARLHQLFHEVASRTIATIVAGRKDEAAASIAIGGEFANASAALTSHMMRWKRDLPAPQPVSAR
jgi:hypothetical protein